MIVAGFGFRSAATVESLLDAFRIHNCAQIDAIATTDDKILSPAFDALSKTLGVEMIAIGSNRLSDVKTQTQSLASLAHRETGSVAEASALCAIGEGAELRGSRSISQDRMATCAIAQGPKI